MVKSVIFVFATTAIVLMGTEVKAEKGESQPVEADEHDRSAYAHASVVVGRPGYVETPYQGKTSPYGPGPSVNTGLVECYACVDCPDVLFNTTTKLCPRSFDPTKKSACVVYAEQYKHLKKSWYIRGCASERGSCTDIKQAHSSNSDIVKLVSCVDCEGDRCNGSSRSMADLTMAVLSIIVTPLVAKHIVS